MSRIARAAELAKKVLGTDRGARNKELMQQMRMDRMVPGRAQNLAETVLKTPSPRSGGLSTAAKALGPSTLAEDIAMAALCPIQDIENGRMGKRSQTSKLLKQVVIFQREILG